MISRKPIRLNIQAAPPEPAPQVEIPAEAPKEAPAPASFIAASGELYIRNPMDPGLYARYETIAHYNSRQGLPTYTRKIPGGTAVQIDFQTLTAKA
jgi:hypothetical protein